MLLMICFCSNFSVQDSASNLPGTHALFKLYKSGKVRCCRRCVSLTHPNCLVQMKIHMAYFSLLICLWLAYLPKLLTSTSNWAEYLEIGGWQMSFLFPKKVITLILLITVQYLIVQGHARCFNVLCLVILLCILKVPTLFLDHDMVSFSEQ